MDVSECRWIQNNQLDVQGVRATLESFLGLLAREGGFEWRAEIQVRTSDSPRDVEGPEVLVNFDGPDADLLLERQGELLQAIEHLGLRLLQMPHEFHDRIRFDCRDYKAARVAELELAAHTAAERVKQSGVPFRFSPMNSRERRILHLAMKNVSGVRSASEGEGRQRAVVIYPA